MKRFLAIFIFVFTNFFIINYAIAAEEVTTDDQYQSQLLASEDNSIAGSLCDLIALSTGGIGITIFAIIFLVIGISVLQGKVSPGLFIGLGVGIATFFSAPKILSLLSPDDRADGGCKCRNTKRVGYFLDANGNKVAITRDLPITEDCKRKE